MLVQWASPNTMGTGSKFERCVKGRVHPTPIATVRREAPSPLPQAHGRWAARSLDAAAPYRPLLTSSGGADRLPTLPA